MSIDKLKEREDLAQNKKLEKAYQDLDGLIGALNKKEVPTDLSASINQDIGLINTFSGTEGELTKALKNTNAKIRKVVAKELKLVAQGHYRNLWMILGMSAFGIPMGVVFSTSLGNFAFLGLGLPIGMGIGIALGVGMDKKAENDGRQLDIE